jgi:hypothetical protein
MALAVISRAPLEEGYNKSGAYRCAPLFGFAFRR